MRRLHTASDDQKMGGGKGVYDDDDAALKIGSALVRAEITPVICETPQP